MRVLTDVPLPVLYTQPKERFDKWLSMIPGGRMATASELKGVSSLTHRPAIDGFEVSC